MERPIITPLLSWAKFLQIRERILQRFMHSSEALAATDFHYRRADESCAKENVMPDISIPDRLGVVIRDPFGGIGAATFVLSCVTAFYDEYRTEGDDFYVYPDYFTFQSEERLVDYLWFYIWPDHKNVQTGREAEAVLQAINDRGINFLLVPDEPTGDPDLEAMTRASFEQRIDGCYLYAPDGQLDGDSFSISLPRDPTWEWIQKTLNTIGDENNDLQTRREREWRVRVENGTLTQEFRRITPENALRYLPDKP
jgi:hypothetical protein